MGMTGFAVGALAPVILGALKQNLGSLSSTFPILAVVWIVCGILMFVVANIFYKKDRERVRQNL
jgi:cyanate permease